MPTYRFYCLDGAGRIRAAEWFDATSDSDAIALVQARHPDSRCEVWRGNQMIGATTPPSGERRQA